MKVVQDINNPNHMYLITLALSINCYQTEFRTQKPEWAKRLPIALSAAMPAGLYRIELGVAVRHISASLAD